MERVNPGLLRASGALRAAVLKSDFLFCNQVRFLSTSYERAEVGWVQGAWCCLPSSSQLVECGSAGATAWKKWDIFEGKTSKFKYFKCFVPIF